MVKWIPFLSFITTLQATLCPLTSEVTYKYKIQVILVVNPSSSRLLVLPNLSSPQWEYLDLQA